MTTVGGKKYRFEIVIFFFFSSYLAEKKILKNTVYDRFESLDSGRNAKYDYQNRRRFACANNK